MKNVYFKKFLPHLIAIGVFLLVTLIVCKPALETDVVLKQSDLIGWQGMSHQSFEYKETHGQFPLWVTSMFSGMPAYQIAIEGSFSLLNYIDRTCQFWLPKPFNWFFLACLSFYFLCLCLKVRTFPAIMAALGFAYCSFSPIIITAGHETQMYALGYAPAVLGGALLIFDRKYLWGFTLTALFTALQISHMHQQISYYLFLVLLILSLAYIIKLVKEKQVAHLAKSLGLLAIAGIIGVAVNSITLFPTYDYAKESKRGGQLVMDGQEKKADNVVNGKTTGLSKEYAFQWSYGRAETMTLMFPGVKGYGNHYAERDGESYFFPKLPGDAKAVGFLTERFGVPEEQAVGIASQSLYWGDQPFTNGPVYLGAVICFLFLFGMFYLKTGHKWWILAGTVFAILLALGSNLAGLNYFLFDHLPFYKNFRVPTMALVIPQLLVPIIAALTLNKLMDNNDADSWKRFKQGAMATAAIFVLALGSYFTSDFGNENRARTTMFNELYNAKDPALQQKLYEGGEALQGKKDNQVYEQMVGNFQGSPTAQKDAREYLNSLRKDRASSFMSDIIRSFLFVLVALVAIAAYLKQKISAMIMLAAVTLTSLIDQLSFDVKYLNEKSFDSKEKYEATEFPMTNADRSILSDKDPNYRVFNLSVSSPFEEARTSYYHKSIGGYHAAKLGIYDDLTSYQLSGQPNIGVLNMLNTKYVIQKQGEDVVASVNPGALGNAWFAKAAKFVKTPQEEMKSLTGFNPKDTAVINEEFQSRTTGYTPADSSATIKQTAFDNEAISYESSSAAPHLAIFSEVYYKDWKAYIDGKETPYFKANYVLRGLLVPAGKHKIDFKFEPKVFFVSKTVSTVSTWFLMALLAVVIVYEFMRSKKRTVEEKVKGYNTL